jgi:CubicO group peptidase (beta-lactamase class C family)
MHVREHHLGEHRLGTAAVELTHDGVQRRSTYPESSAFVSQHVSPAARSRGAPCGIAPVGNRPRSRDNDDARSVAGAGHQRNQRVVDHQRPHLETYAPHDAANGRGVRLPIDAGNAKANCGWLDVAVPDRLLHDAMQHLLDFELARGLEVGSATARFGDEVASLVGKETHRLRSARVDAEHVHMVVMVHSGHVTAPFREAHHVLSQGVARRSFPAAVIEVGTSAQPQWREAFGRLTYTADSPQTQPDTVFDLASLTKVLATTPLFMRQIERGTLALDDRITEYLPRWHGRDREHVTVRDLLAHCSGLAAYAPYYLTVRGREAIEQEICASPLEYAPRSRSIYSDLGFMLLGFILEDLGSLPVQFDSLKAQMQNPEDLQFHPPAIWMARTAPTRHSEWRGRLLCGEVDDENTWALGGAAGQAGLFGTAAAVGVCARHVMQVLGGRVGAFRPDTMMEFAVRRLDVPDSSRALGWDTMLPSSSCGTRMSARAIGHTGFTGTSLWIDPERDVYVALLTNRVHADGSNGAIQEVRRAVHDAVIREL